LTVCRARDQPAGPDRRDHPMEACGLTMAGGRCERDRDHPYARSAPTGVRELDAAVPEWRPRCSCLTCSTTSSPASSPTPLPSRPLGRQFPGRRADEDVDPRFRFNGFLTTAPRTGRLQEKRPGSALSVAGAWVKVRRARDQSGGGDGRRGRGLGPSPANGSGWGEDPEIPTGHDRNTGIGVSSMPTATRCLSAQRSTVSRSHTRIGRSAAPMTPLNPPQPSSPTPVESIRCFGRRALPGRAAA
jgi:hypothetical protein